MSSTFSIIIPSLNSALIDRVIAAIRHQTRPVYEIIVVGQDCYGLIPDDVQFIQTEQPISAAAARNLGAKHASGDYLLFIDADCIATPDLIEQIECCHNQGHVIAGGGVGIEHNDYWARCDNLLVFADFLRTAPAGERSFLASLNLSLPRSVFWKLNGFDQSYPGAAGEDLDLSLRLRASGYRLHFAPEAWVAHEHQRSNAGQVWRHLRGFGRAQVRIANSQPLSASRIAQLPPGSFGLIMVAAVFLACLDSMMLFATRPRLWPYIMNFPGIVWARSGWYWGVAEGLSVQIHQTQ